MKNYILDACALIAVFNKESGAEPVKEILENSKLKLNKVYMNTINLLEVYYGILREYGVDIANEILISIQASPIEVINVISDDLFKQAGRLKASYKVSLADSIVLAEGVTRNATVISSDHHEFDVIEEREDIEFLWIR